MKRLINHISMHSALNASLCALVLSVCCVSPVAAQEEDDATEEAVTVKRVIKKKEAKQYPTKNVKGVIVDDATGEPMGGVRVQALGLERYSTLTEEDGSYSLDIPTFSDALYLYAEGYNPMQAAVKEGKADVRMIGDGFKSFFTDGTSITSQKKINIAETSGQTFETEIEKHLSADIHNVLRSGMTGQGLFMTIRGISSINANSQPIIVLDGNIIDPQYDRESMHVGFYNNLLAGIDPENVESVQVLKNGTALYGAKGANGVIIINTKRGRSMATKIGVRIYAGFEMQPRTLSVLNGNQYKNYLGDLVNTVKDNNIYSPSAMPFLDNSPSNYYRKVFSNDEDWQKDLYRTGVSQNYKISVEGGDDIGMYALSLGYSQTKGNTVGNDMSRLNLRFNTDIKIASKLKTGLDIAFNQNDYSMFDNGWAQNYDMQNIGSTNVLGLVMPSFLSPYSYYMDEDKLGDSSISKDQILSRTDGSGGFDWAGKYAEDGYINMDWVKNPFMFPKYIGRDGINEALRNPYWIMQNGVGDTKNSAQTTGINLNVSPSYQVTRTFNISDRFNYNMVRNSEKYYLPYAGATPYMLTDLGNITSQMKTFFGKETTIQNDLRLDWRNTYGAHTVNVFGGWRYNNYSYSCNYMSAYNNNNDKLPILDKNMAYVNYNGTNDNWIDMTYYLDANYNYKNRYFADFSLSLQSSSRFGKHTTGGLKMFGVSWGVFPSLQLGWIISNESWFKTGRGVNYLKLTAGVEQVGNDNLDYYASRTYWESQKVTDNTVGLFLKNIENSGIQWETTTKWNVALEGSFLNNRLQAGIDLFWHNTNNLLTIGTIPYLSGLKDYWTNDGSLTNKGFEVHVNANLINTKAWKWELGASMGHYNNKITHMPTIDGFNGRVYSIYGDKNILAAEGYAIGSFYGWQTDGIFKSTEEAMEAHLEYPTYSAAGNKLFQAGDVKFVDQNGDGIIDDQDKVVLGNPHPDIYGNIYTSLTWKNLRLDVNFKYSLGNDIYNYQRSRIEGLNTTYNQTLAATRRWTYEGQVTDMPKACYTNSDDWRNNERMSDRWIEDGSYLKMKNIRLTYKLPYRNNWLQGLQIWGEANNVFCITRYLGTDPEFSSKNSALYQGIDTGLLPSARNFNFGVSINL